jgi:murein DD-endopeptidase MepM/ murein hydrolase activator NlpD
MTGGKDMAQLSAEQIYQVAIDVGFTPDQAVTFTAISLAESGGRTGAHNTTGEDSRGLWQINVGPGVRENKWGDLTDPHTNARAAYEISGGGTNFSPWTVTHDVNAGTGHDYRRFAEAAREASHGAGQGNFAGVEGYGHLPRDPSEAGSLTDQARGPAGDPHALDPQPDDGHEQLPPDGHYRPISDAEFRDSYGEPRPGHAHQGVDIGAPDGTPIHAVTGGTLMAGSDPGGGITVTIQGDDGRRYYYAHLQEGSTQGLGLQQGQHVAAGETIGLVGSTGRSTGPHLHLEIFDTDGQHINPYTFIEPLPDPEDALVAAGPSAPVLPAGPDTDHDQLPDEFELAHGTDPNVADSDHDGLTDGFEIRRHSDPTQADADRDGLGDADEILRLRSDPTQADTDRDGMDDGLEDAIGRDVLHGVAADGGVAAAGAATLKSGEPGQPGPPGQSGATGDSDQDGLSDAFEASLGSDPTQADSDQDGFDDGLEHAFGTSAVDADTDHDGLSDHYEMNHDMDPFEAMQFDDDPFSSVDQIDGMSDDPAAGVRSAFDDDHDHDHGDGDLTDPDNDRPAHVGG